MAKARPRRINRLRRCAAALAPPLLLMSAAPPAYGDKAQDLLGVADLDPVLCEVIDDAYADGSGSLPALVRKVASGQMHPGAAAQAVVSDAQSRVMQTMKRLGLGMEALRLQAAWQAFAQAKLHAKASQHLHLPKPPGATGNIDLPALHHKATGADAPDIDKKLKQLDRQLAHSISPHPRGPALNESEARAAHVRDIHARAADVTASAARPDSHKPALSALRRHGDGDGQRQGPSVTQPDATRPGKLHPALDKTLGAVDSLAKQPGAAAHVHVSVPSLSTAQTGMKAPSADDITAKLRAGLNDPAAALSDVPGGLSGLSDLPDRPGIGPKVDAASAAGLNPNAGSDINAKLHALANPDDLSKRAGAGVDVDAIRRKAQQGVDVAALRKKAEGAVDVSAIRRKSSTKLDVKLDEARDKIKAAMKTAFGKANGFMQKKVDEKQNDYNNKKAAYNAIQVPPIRKHRICAKHVVGICVKHTHVPTQSSVEAHNRGLAKKKIAKGNMDAAKKELEKYQKGKQHLLQTETDTYGQLDTVFASANTSTTLTTQVDASLADTATAQKPDKKQKRVPGQGHDHDVIVIAEDIGETIISAGTITAAIGVDANATTHIGAIGDLRDTRIGGDLRERIVAPGVISAALGYNTRSDVRLGDTDGMIGGRVERHINAAGVLSAAIGADSAASVMIGNIDGRVDTSARQDATVVGALAAAIGADTQAHIRMANLGAQARAGSLDQRLVQATPAIAAAIGHDAEALISAGQINGDVRGHLRQHITLGSVIAAAVGNRTETKIRIGDVNHDVQGDLRQTITAGDITNIAIGSGTKANTDIGVIDAPVTGDVDMHIATGVITTATVGIGTGAETVVGSVRAPVSGDLDVDISVGDITTFSLGIGIGGDADIRARTYVGSVFQPVSGSRSINVHTGSIVSLGFGLDLDLGPFGELRIVESECNGGSVRLGNIGNPC